MKKEIFRPERHSKGWGYEDWIANKGEYCGKVLHFDKGKKCSLHYHQLKDETFYLARGELEVLLADSVVEYEKGNTGKIVLKEGECLYIWAGRVHQMMALKESDLIEMSTEHFEQDSHRIERGD